MNNIPHLRPYNFLLYQNYPNPFNSSTHIFFQIYKGGDVSLEIYNLNGQLVKSLINKKHKEGRYDIIWNGSDENGHLVASGIYFCQFKVNGKVRINKLTLIR